MTSGIVISSKIDTTEIATEALKRIGELYSIEAEIWGKRLAARKAKTLLQL